MDYEHIPFRCHKCHEHGHLYKDCPLNKLESNMKATTGKDPEGFTKVGGKGKGGKQYLLSLRFSLEVIKEGVV